MSNDSKNFNFNNNLSLNKHFNSENLHIKKVIFIKIFLINS